MKWFKRLFGREQALKPSVDEMASSTPDFEHILAKVRECAQSMYGFFSGEVDDDTPLRELSPGIFQIDLTQLFMLVEQEFGIELPDDGWESTSTPNWEYVTQRSLAEMVELVLKYPDQFSRQEVDERRAEPVDPITVLTATGSRSLLSRRHRCGIRSLRDGTRSHRRT